MSVFITYLSYNKYLKRTLASSCCTIGLCGPGRADLISSGLPLQAALARGRKAPVFLNSGRRWANTEPLSGLASPVGPWCWAGRVPGLWVPLDGSQGILPAGLWAGTHWSLPTLPCPGGAGRLQPRNEGRAEALVRGSCPRSHAHPSGWPRARPTRLPSALGCGSLDGGTPPFPGAAWAPGPGKPLWDLLTKLHRPFQVGMMLPIGDEKTEAQHGEATPGSPGFLGSPRPQSSPTRPAGLPSQPLLPSCLFTDPGAPFTQHCAPPSLPLLLIYVPTGLGCPQPGSSFLGLSTLCGSSHRQPGVTESSQPLHLEHSAKPTNHISEPHLFCSQTCASVRWAGLCSTWDPISWNHLPAPMPWSGTKASLPRGPGFLPACRREPGPGLERGRQRLQPLFPLSWTPHDALLPGNVPRERGTKLGPPFRAGEIDPSLAGGEEGSRRVCRVGDAVAAILGKRTRSRGIGGHIRPRG